MNSNETFEKMVPVLYLDLDGTVRHGADERDGKFVNCADDVVIFDGVRDALAAYKKAGWRIVGVSNQGGIALGIVSMGDVAQAMMRTQQLCGDAFDKLTWCRHHPSADTQEMAKCWCRKPRAGGALQAVLDLAKRTGEIYPPHLALFVGDRPEDEGCADALNVMFIDAKAWRANPLAYLNR